VRGKTGSGNDFRIVGKSRSLSDLSRPPAENGDSGPNPDLGKRVVQQGTVRSLTLLFFGLISHASHGPLGGVSLQLIQLDPGEIVGFRRDNKRFRPVILQ
jgi:hypothetical protein